MSSKSGSAVIQKAFAKKKKDFKGFSMRWMASQLGISHVYLSHILRGLRPIPVNIVEPLCAVLDLDSVAKAKVFNDAFSSKGYRPLSDSKKSRLQSGKNWNLVPLKDFELLSRWETMAILMTTLLAAYDGTNEFIAERLFLPKVLVNSVTDVLHKKGYLVLKNGKLVASDRYYEYQSLSSREQIRKYHKSVLGKAKEVLEQKTDETSREKRLITSASVTCSKEDVARLKNKMADFLKEFVEESASSRADEVYQIGLQFFPVTNPAAH